MDLNDSLAEVCELAKYPAAGGPVTLAFSAQTGDVVACGEWGSGDYKECFSFDGIIWDPLPPLQENHYPYAYETRSFFMDGIGWWVGGVDGSGGMVNELFNSEGQWATLPVDSPYENIDYPYPCVVQLNSTHIFLSGGYHYDNVIPSNVVDTWILDLNTLVWTPLTPMLTPRYYHGCVLTDDGEVLIAGGKGGGSSVHVFNPVSLEWREIGNLPAEMEIWYPSLLLWNDKIILMETGSDHIWLMEEDQGWRLMDITMGPTYYYGAYDNAVLVPDLWRMGCI